MRLNKFELWINNSLIREIAFKDGLNLITNDLNIGRSGNSVGKSTLSRVIDYLFLGSIDSIYIDEEFSKPNERIQTLFATSSVYVRLFYSDFNNVTHSIARNLTIDNSNNKFYFDDKEISETEYQKDVLKSFFDIESTRPSLRFLAPKFIRNSSHRMLNTTKFLDKHTSDKDYSELFLFLFGFQNTNLLADKRSATNRLKAKNKIRLALNSVVKTEKPSARILELKNQVNNLEETFFDIEIDSGYPNSVDKLAELNQAEENTSKALLNSERKIENINKTVEYLSNQGGNSLIAELNAIYGYANINIQNAIRDFEDVLTFHDNLVAKKKQFLTIDLPELIRSKDELSEKLNKITSEKHEIFSKIKSQESLEKFTAKLKELGELKVVLGKLEGLVEQQLNAVEKHDSAEEDLSRILILISNNLDQINAFEAIFNKYFGEITKVTHGENYSFNLGFDKDSGTCELKVNSSVSNPEGGKKKAEVIAFDFAYIYAVSKTEIKRPNFIFHDGIEEIDQKQISQIFAIAEKMPGQQFVAILADKLTSEMHTKYLPNIILELSETNMFFKV